MSTDTVREVLLECVGETLAAKAPEATKGPEATKAPETVTLATATEVADGLCDAFDLKDIASVARSVRRSDLKAELKARRAAREATIQ